MIWLVRFAVCAMMPRAAGLPGVADTGIDDFLVRFKRESNLMVWIGVLFGSVFFQLSPLLTLGVPLPAVLLPRPLLDRHANNIAKHPLYLVRQIVFMVKMAAGLCWGAHPSVRAQLNLPAYPADPGTYRVD